LLIPYSIGITNSQSTFISNGFLNIELLKPFQLFGLDYLDPIPHALFWSLLFNSVTYFAVSVSFKGNYRERNYAEMFVDINKYITNHENAFIWKGTAYRNDIEKVLIRFLGEERTKRAMNIFNVKYNVDKNIELADARLIKFSENLLTGHIGTASARILISSVVKEEKISLPEVLKILEESKENIIVNKKLTETSNELKEITAKLQDANDSLMIKDQQKDEFLDTVTHELRTPITAIRAASEILHDDDEIPEELKKQFLQNIISESDRLNRLIDKILDLEKFETGKQTIHPTQNNLVVTIEKSIEPLQQLANGAKMLVSMAGAMSTAEIGKIFAEIIRQDKVQIISCTGANLEEDIMNLVAHSHYERVPHYRDLTPQDEWDLLERGLNRVTDTCIPEHEAFRRLQKHIYKIWKDADDKGERYFPHEFMYKMLLSGVLEEYYESNILYMNS
jgi:signal transduction histidine kinase